MTTPLRPKEEATDEDIEHMWVEALAQIMAIEPATENWKAQVLPLARIKKIMKSEEIAHAAAAAASTSSLDPTTTSKDGGSSSSSSSVRFMIAGEAPVLLGKACELLVGELTLRSWRHTERARRRTLQRQDIMAATGENELYDFLIDIVPRAPPAQERTRRRRDDDDVPSSASVHDDRSGAHHVDPNALAHVHNVHAAHHVSTAAPAVVGDDHAAAAAQPGVVDAELRLAHLKQMQEQFLLLQQQMRDGGVTVNSAAAAAAGLVNPAAFALAPPQLRADAASANVAADGTDAAAANR